MTVAPNYWIIDYLTTKNFEGNSLTNGEENVWLSDKFGAESSYDATFEDRTLIDPDNPPTFSTKEMLGQ